MTTHNIRPILIGDIGDLKEVLKSIDLFPAPMLDDMITDYFENDNSEDIWFTCVERSVPVSIGYCAQEKLASGTYNLYAIGIKKEYQGKGIGSRMMYYIEEILRRKKARILIVETSGNPIYNKTRNFYLKLNYTEEAIIREFWNEGEDKVIFWKKL